MSTVMYGGSKISPAPNAAAILSCPTCAGAFMSNLSGEFSHVSCIDATARARRPSDSSAAYLGTTEHHATASAPHSSAGEAEENAFANSALSKSAQFESSKSLSESLRRAFAAGADTRAQCVRVFPMSMQYILSFSSAIFYGRLKSAAPPLFAARPSR